MIARHFLIGLMAFTTLPQQPRLEQVTPRFFLVDLGLSADVPNLNVLEVDEATGVSYAVRCGPKPPNRSARCERRLS